MTRAHDLPPDAAPSGSHGEPDLDQHGLRIYLLGEFRVAIGDALLPQSVWGRRRARGLLKLLALSPRQRLHREEIIEQLWPEQDPDTAAANLRVTLHAVRQALRAGEGRESPFAQAIDDEIVLQRVGRAWVDADAFEHAAGAALRSGSVADLRAALDLYTGELLPEDRYEDWASALRERLRGLHLSLLSALAGALEGAGDAAGAIDALESVLAADPTDEAAARRLMRAYTASGQRHRALRLFRRLRDALQRDLDVPPEAETQQVYGDILSGAVSAPPAPSPIPDRAARHNIRLPLTSFVGREEELRRIREQLATTRLLTLRGPAGCGKTRLATAAGHALLDTFADGVWFVNLSPLVSAEPIVSTIAGAMGLTLDASQAELPALVEALRSKQALLIVDNCEHLIEASARVAEALLGECPALRVMTTSREPLRVAGEAVLLVPALPLPVAGAQSLEQARQSDAARLFVDRARSLQPEFELTAETAPLVVDICRRLDGLPLAIELAAARVPLLSLEQLARRLSDPLQVLTGGSRTAERRQQTLRATLDWSFDALDDPEQRLLERLSVFAGEWTLEAAELVCAGDGIAEREVLTLLAQLVDKSLLEARAGGSEARYHLLVTIRQYAAERHAARGDAAAHTLQRRLADYCVQLAEAAGTGLLGAEQGAWLERLELELDNLRAALDWCERTGELERQLRIAASLVRMWWIRGYANEGRRWLEGALRIAEQQPGFDPGVRARALQAAGNLARMQGEIELAQQHLETCLVLQREHGDPSELAHVLNYLAALLGVRGDLPRAIELAQEGLALFRQVGERRGIALTLGTLGEVYYTAGDAPQASQYLEGALALDREIGDTHSIAITLNNLGEALRTQGLLDQAAASFEESLVIFRELEATHGVAYLLANLGDIASGQGQHQTALRHYMEALGIFHLLGYRQAMLGVVANMAALDARQGQAERAARLLGAEDALRAEAGFASTPVERAEIDETVAVIHSRLDQEAFERAWDAGRRMSLEDVVALAGSVELTTSPALAEPRLSPRERDVALLAARGMTNQQIAEALGITVRTAETHVGNVLRKLGLGSRRDLSAWVEESGGGVS
ncbi:MAG TPA: tetratricopeptide repeat protein [Thermomicrobiales bacterium]|nr:tetratricopeptide repeat protein [Thermomicrobiales bacterium]